ERGQSKQEEFMKKVQEMMVEQEKQRIPIAQPLPLTTDEPECLVKPPVKESTGPVDLVLHSDVRAVDLVLHSDVRAVERAEFYQQSKQDQVSIKKCEACTYVFERRAHMF
ncbi:WVD2-like protein 4, partial [Tanacetum coccineum]